MAPQLDNGTWSIQQGGNVVGYVWVESTGKEYFLNNPNVIYPFTLKTTFADAGVSFTRRSDFKAWAIDPNKGGLDPNAVETYAYCQYMSPWP